MSIGISELAFETLFIMLLSSF